jgi:hypothetical protein
MSQPTLSSAALPAHQSIFGSNATPSPKNELGDLPVEIVTKIFQFAIPVLTHSSTVLTLRSCAQIKIGKIFVLPANSAIVLWHRSYGSLSSPTFNRNKSTEGS